LLFHAYLESRHVVRVFDFVETGGLERQRAGSGKWIGFLREDESGGEQKGHEKARVK
jgi:hypothetical protein